MLINSSRKTGKKFKEKLVNSWNRKGFMIISGKRFLAFTTLSETEEGNGNPLQYSCLENPMDRGAWQATVHRVARDEHVLVTKPPPPPYLRI